MLISHFMFDIVATYLAATDCREIMLFIGEPKGRSMMISNSNRLYTMSATDSLHGCNRHKLFRGAGLPLYHHTPPRPLLPTIRNSPVALLKATSIQCMFQMKAFWAFGSKSGFKFPENTTALSCNVLQHPATSCSTLQHPAVRYKTLTWMQTSELRERPWLALFEITRLFER